MRRERGLLLIVLGGGVILLHQSYTEYRQFFQALAQNAGITLHVRNQYGANNHHIAETCFKAVARALRAAIEADPRQAGAIPSTKGTLGG